jgi:tetratricopeptide (TPR) repeat protein
MKYILHTLAVALLMSCSKSADEKCNIANPEDYNVYLNTKKNTSEVEFLEKQIAFWSKKLNESPRGFTFYQKRGGAYSQLFEETGKVENLHLANDDFLEAGKLIKGKGQASNLLSLSSLAIKMHDFKTAEIYALDAQIFTNEKFGPLMMQFDAEMEVGNFNIAGGILDMNKRMDSFDYLVRLSKYKDYEGNLDSAIVYMEQAQQLIANENSEQALWAKANLGDMYGHAGRIEDSYNNYLKVLAMDSTYDYALRGIAWIAYSADRNAAEAKRILNVLKERTEMPDTYLLLAEIEEFEGNQNEARKHLQTFKEEANKAKYVGMYNKYLIDIYIAEENFEEAKRLAETEVNNRPTPATYDWLAWTHYKSGDLDKAVEMYKSNIEGETYEPDVIYHMGVVYKDANRNKGLDYLKESMDASYELGPLVEMEIKQKIKG